MAERSIPPAVLGVLRPPSGGLVTATRVDCSVKTAFDERRNTLKNDRIGLFLLTALLVGCGGSQPASKNGAGGTKAGNKIQAVATVGMVADLVHNVGGDYVEVTQICGTGVDPHGYMPTSDDVRDIMAAEVVFYCGLMLEGKMVSTLETLGKSKPVIAVTTAIDASRVISDSASERETESAAQIGGTVHGDPHVWNDVSMWSECVDVIREQLSRQQPEHADAFAANASTYQKRLAELHEYGINAIATIPEEGRLLITSHDAFSYFGRAYGLDVQGIQGISTESEAGLQQINQLVDLLIKRDIKAVFVESSVSPKSVESLIEGAADKGHKVSKGGTLFSDAMGAEGSYEGTYIGMLDHILTTATLALGGEADAGGFQGKLSGAAEH